MASKSKINSQINTIQQLIEEAISLDAMMCGSFSKAYRRCGKPNCKCSSAGEKGHPFFRISYFEKGKQRTMTIKEKDKRRMENLVENYRKFKDYKRKIKVECENLIARMNDFQNSMVDKMKKEIKSL